MCIKIVKMKKKHNNKHHVVENYESVAFKGLSFYKENDLNKIYLFSSFGKIMESYEGKLFTCQLDNRITKIIIVLK